MANDASFEARDHLNFLSFFVPRLVTKHRRGIAQNIKISSYPPRVQISSVFDAARTPNGCCLLPQEHRPPSTCTRQRGVAVVRTLPSLMLQSAPDKLR